MWLINACVSVFLVFPSVYLGGQVTVRVGEVESSSIKGVTSYRSHKEQVLG